MTIDKDTIIASSAFVHGAEEQATVDLTVPEGPGSYLIVPCTFQPGQECNFTLTLYHTDPKLNLTPLKGSRLPPPPPGSKHEKKKGGGKMGPPISKHDIGQVRAEAAAAKKAAGDAPLARTSSATMAKWATLSGWRWSWRSRWARRPRMSPSLL